MLTWMEFSMRQVSSIRTEQRLGDSFFPSLKTSKQLVVLSLDFSPVVLVLPRCCFARDGEKRLVVEQRC